MDTITAILIGFTLAALAWPQIIRHRGMFFLSLVPTLFLLLLYVLAGAAAQAQAAYVVVAFFSLLAGLLQLAAVLLLILAFSGLSLWELLQEIALSFRSLQQRSPGFPVVPPPPPPGDQGPRK